jgi:hypothetical protein
MRLSRIIKAFVAIEKKAGLTEASLAYYRRLKTALEDIEEANRQVSHRNLRLPIFRARQSDQYKQKRGANDAAFCNLFDVRRLSARHLGRHVALVLHDDLVERAEIGFGRRHQRIRIGRL